MSLRLFPIVKWIGSTTSLIWTDNHHYMFDTENLLRVLRNAGFSDVQSRNFDPALDMAEREGESIYAVGLKS